MRTTLRKHSARARGSFLLDAVVGMVFLALVFVTLLTTMVTGVRSSRRSREHLQASLAARQVIENVRTFRGGLATGSYSDATSFGPVAPLANLANSSVAATISAWSGSTYQIVVTVTWRSVPGKATMTKTVTTLFSSDGVAE